MYEDLSNPYGIAGTLLHVQVSQSYLSKPVSILLSFLLFQAAFLEPIPYVKNDLSWSYSVYWSKPAVLFIFFDFSARASAFLEGIRRTLISSIQVVLSSLFPPGISFSSQGSHNQSVRSISIGSF